MRPNTLGFAIQSSVFEVKDEQPALVGIVAAKMKTAYQLEAGKHLFMVVGESADFMSADLEADKTYYALVTPRMGLWKARFSLKAVHENELGSSKVNEWLDSCSWVETNEASNRWAEKNRKSTKSLHDKYYVKWMGKAAADRPHLAPQDGR